MNSQGDKTLLRHGIKITSSRICRDSVSPTSEILNHIAEFLRKLREINSLFKIMKNYLDLLLASPKNVKSTNLLTL